MAQIDVERRGGRAGRYQKIVGLEELDDAAVERGALALGPGDGRRRLAEAALGVPHDVGLELVAMLLELLLAVDHELLAAQVQKRLIDGADVGRSLLDD